MQEVRTDPWFGKILILETERFRVHSALLLRDCEKLAAGNTPGDCD